LLCVTRERGKREEKEILQCQTTSLVIHCVCHRWPICRTLMYHLNPYSWSYTPLTKLHSIQLRYSVWRRNTWDHFLILPTDSTSTDNIFKPYPHLQTFPPLWTSLPISKINCNVCTITCNLTPWQYPLLWVKVLQDLFPIVMVSLGNVDEVVPPPATHLPTLLCPTLGNHTLFVEYSTATDSDASSSLQHSIPHFLLHHQLPLQMEGEPAVTPSDPQPHGPIMTLVVLNGCASLWEVLTHRHTDISGIVQ